MEKYRQCTRCVMDNKSDKSITFDDNGYCNYCTDVLKRMPNEYFPNEKGMEYLKGIVSKIKHDCKYDSYDCIVGVSGGIDSSYILYLGAKFELRMLAIHVDDGFDNPIATENLKKLMKKTRTKMVTIYPNREEYMDIIKSFFMASVSNLAFAQDNIIIKTLQDYAEENHIKYSLDGHNFSHECILERGVKTVNASDKKFIYGIHEKYGTVPLNNIKFTSLTEHYLKRNYISKVCHIRPLNYINYNLEDAIKRLGEYCDFEYYGGKHYESILTRFLQCYYLPVKFGQDKRKSHYSSLIVSGQMTRQEALEKLQEPLYPSADLLKQDKSYIAHSLKITVQELDEYIKYPPVNDYNYPHSFFNKLAPLARKFRKFIE